MGILDRLMGKKEKASREIRVSFYLTPTQQQAFQKLQSFYQGVEKDLLQMESMGKEPDEKIRYETVKKFYERDIPIGVIRPLQQFEQRMESSDYYELLEEKGLFSLWMEDPDEAWRYLLPRVYRKLEYDGKSFPFEDQVSDALVACQKKLELVNKVLESMEAK